MMLRVLAAGALGLLLACGGAALAEPVVPPVQAAPAVPVAAPARAAIPYKKDKEGGGSLAYQSVAALILASLAAYGIVLGLKKLNGMPGGALRKERHLTVRESVRLSRRSVLHVVDYHGDELLLAESEHGLTLVSTRPTAGAAHA